MFKKKNKELSLNDKLREIRFKQAQLRDTQTKALSFETGQFKIIEIPYRTSCWDEQLHFESKYLMIVREQETNKLFIIEGELEEGYPNLIDEFHKNLIIEKTFIVTDKLEIIPQFSILQLGSFENVILHNVKIEDLKPENY